jgi:Plavaka transposase
MTYQCLHCSRIFSTPSGLKRHISDKHQYIDEGEPSQSNLLPYEEPGLWDEDFIMEDDEDMEDIEDDEDVKDVEDEPITLEQTDEDARLSEISEDESKQGNITDEEINDNLTYPLSIDPEDYCGTTLDDAIKDKMHPSNTEWPNDIYREFMEIVMEFQLSNACGDRIIKLIDKSNKNKNIDKHLLPKNTTEGRKFLDASEFPYMKFKTVPITNFQDTDYNFYYQPIIHGIKVLLLQSDINEEFVFKYQNDNTSIKTYSEQFESNWWNITQAKIPVDNHLLSIILYADSTTCDHLGKTSEHPVYISLGNIPNWQRNKSHSKVLVGYLPKLKAKDNITKNSESFRRLQRQVFQRCLRILLTPILNQNDMFFVINNEIYPFTPKISVILADMAEAATFTATYLPSTSKRPCCFCLISNEDLNNMTLSNVILRTPEKMKEAIDLNQANELSIHADFNFFWNFKDFNIYEATVPDRMHMLDLGITKYLLEFTRAYLQTKVNNKAIRDMDHRLCAVPRYPGLIILKNGLENISKFTANDYRNIMKVIIFVMDNLYDNYKEGGIPCKRLCNIFYKYLKMYMKLRQESFTDTDLTELEVNMIINFKSIFFF